MNDENNDHHNHINLDLSLGLPQEQDPVDEQDQSVPHQEQDPVEEHGQGQGQDSFMELLRSYPPQNIQHSLPPPHQMTSFADFTNGTNPWIVAANALPPSILPPSVSVTAPSPFHQPSGQFIHPPQANQVGTVALETPRRGRPPAGQGNQARRVRAVDRNVGDREIIPPFPWATKKPAGIQTFRDLSSKNINAISGQVHCKSCDNTLTLEYNLREKFLELYQYIKHNKEVLRQRAPAMWMTPELISCGTCNSEMRPVISENKEEINWLFLLLGQMLGVCTLDQLKYFCESNSQHRTGAKDRVLYTTYLGLCKQLAPDGPFSL